MIGRGTLPQRFGGMPSACLVCRRLAAGTGYSPNRRAETIAWTCENIACIRAAPKVFHMPMTELLRIERACLRDAVDTMAGPYLDGIGVTDLAQLEPHQLDEFLERLLLGYEQAMRTRAQAYEAPF